MTALPAFNFVSAVQALYGTDGAKRFEANQWLQEFSSTPGAWDQGTAVLRSDYPSELQFFAANLLLTKVRRDWTTLSAGERSYVDGAISESLRSLAKSSSTTRVVLQRLCCVTSAIAVASGPQAVQSVANEGLSFISDGVTQQSSVAITCGVCVLGALSEELSGLGQAKKSALLSFIPLHQVLQALSYIIATGPQGDSALCCAAVRAVYSWLSLPERQPGVDVSFDALYTHQVQLIDALLACLKRSDPSVLDAVTDVFLLLLANTNNTEAGVAATRKLLGEIISQRERVAHPQETAFSTCVALLGTQYAEENPEEAAGGSTQAEALAEVMLCCMTREERSIVETACEYFYIISTVPMAERQPSLQVPLYQQLIQVLCERVMYPLGFTTWEECYETDRDAFNRFRDDILVDTMTTCYGVLRMQYISFWCSRLPAARHWNDAEAALWAIRRVSESVLEWCTTGNSGDENMQPTEAMRQDQQLTQEVMWQLLMQLLRKEAHLMSPAWHDIPWIKQTAANLIAAYSPLWDSATLVPPEYALHYLMDGLQDTRACMSCARAFEVLCRHVSGSLSSRSELVEGLIAAIPQATTGMSSSVRCHLYSGVATIIQKMAPRETASAIAVKLITPMLEMTQECITASSSEATAAKAVSDLQAHLNVIAAVMRALGAGSEDVGPHTSPPPQFAVLQWCQNVLQSVFVIPHLQSHEGVVTAACKVVLVSLECTWPEVVPLLLPLLTAVSHCYVSHHHICCINLMANAVTCCSSCTEMNPVIAEWTGRVMEGSAAMFQVNTVPGDADAIKSVFRYAFACVAGWEQFTAQHHTLDTFVCWAVQAVAVRDADAVRSVLLFVEAVLKGNQKYGVPLNAAVVVQVVQQRCCALACSLVAAAADTCPKGAVRHVANCLYLLLEQPSCTESVQQAVHALVTTEGFAGVPPHQFSVEDKLRFLQVLLRRPALPTRRFTACFIDFAGVFRGEATPDTILAYEM